jgi:predicted transcriptional regulator
MAATNVFLPEELLHEVEETALAQNRKAAEVVEEAVRRYVAIQRHAAFAEKMERRARAKGIREEDVPRLVEEVRREKRQHGL